MVISLSDAQKNVQNDVDYHVIDQYRRNSWLLDHLSFDDCVNPGSGGSTMTYSYTRLVNARKAGTRAINSEYTPGQATRTRASADLKVLGGAFQVDRVIADLGAAQTNEVSFQMDEMLKGAIAGFQDSVINGDTAVDANGFDGLDKILTSSSTEVIPGGSAAYVDWTAVTVNTVPLAINAVSIIEDFVGRVVGGADAILGNRSGLLTLARIGRLAGYVTESEDAFGKPITTFAGVPLVDLGNVVADGGSTESAIIPIETRDPDGAGAGGNITGLTDLYAVKFGLDAFHGVSKVGPLLKTWLPDFSTAGAVKKGEVEMVAATVLKRTTGAAVLRNVKVQ